MPNETGIQYGSVTTRPLRFSVRVGEPVAVPTNIGFEIRVSFQEEVAKQSINVRLLVSYHDADAGNVGEDPYLLFESLTSVGVRGLDDLAGKGQEAIPMPVRASLFGIALGTARGMIRVQTSGYEISSVELPVVSPMQILLDAEASPEVD